MYTGYGLVLDSEIALPNWALPGLRPSARTS